MKKGQLKLTREELDERVARGGNCKQCGKKHDGLHFSCAKCGMPFALVVYRAGVVTVMCPACHYGVKFYVKSTQELEDQFKLAVLLTPRDKPKIQ